MDAPLRLPPQVAPLPLPIHPRRSEQAGNLEAWINLAVAALKHFVGRGRSLRGVRAKKFQASMSSSLTSYLSPRLDIFTYSVSLMIIDRS